ncbi:hypothetical protein [Lacticaseibacillus kribbianus]|uniref:hypothetical protein n=1 Tax=Lacticaseibacillus kribbianus TaxID=2926292 RepID=UPI001CD49593|nr:hypothetical protein [Lacticaseibacillus kribbianus]
MRLTTRLTTILAAATLATAAAPVAGALAGEQAATGHLKATVPETLTILLPVNPGELFADPYFDGNIDATLFSGSQSLKVATNAAGQKMTLTATTTTLNRPEGAGGPVPMYVYNPATGIKWNDQEAEATWEPAPGELLDATFRFLSQHIPWPGSGPGTIAGDYSTTIDYKLTTKPL